MGSMISGRVEMRRMDQEAEGSLEAWQHDYKLQLCPRRLPATQRSSSIMEHKSNSKTERYVRLRTDL